MRKSLVITLVVTQALALCASFTHLHSVAQHRRHSCRRPQLSAAFQPPVTPLAEEWPASPLALPSSTARSVAQRLRVLMHSISAFLKRTDASLLLGVLAGILSYVAFPAVCVVMRSWTQLPVGRKGAFAGLGSGYTTDVWGAFCPVVGILFATLISSTVDKLWARQEALRRHLVSEAESLAHLTELLYQADQADTAAAARLATAVTLEYYRSGSVDAVDAVDAVDTVDAPADGASSDANGHESTPTPLSADGGSAAPSPPRAPLAREAFVASDWLQRQAGTHVPLDAGGNVGARTPWEEHGGGTAGGTADGGSAASSSRRIEPRMDPSRIEASVREERLKRQASFRAIARHLHTLSHLVWGSRALREARAASKDSASAGAEGAPKPSSASSSPPPPPSSSSSASAASAASSAFASSRSSPDRNAYEAELNSISSGDDPLMELMTLHPQYTLVDAQYGAAEQSAWRAASAEARATIAQLMVARGQRLAVMESRPPRAHWVVLSATGSSLVLGFAIVSAATRPATAVASRLLFTSLSLSLLVVLRLLKDLAEPFDQGGYTLAVKNAAGAILAPTRRRLVSALTRVPRASSTKPTKRATVLLNPALRQ